MPSFSHSIDVQRLPGEIFPWLLEEDKVPVWTSSLQRYEVVGALGRGARARQTLDIGGGLLLDMEITRYEPPRQAESRFETNGVKLVSAYLLEPAGRGTRLTQTLDAKAGGITARMLIPVVQGRLEKKVASDLERLRGVLEGS